MIYKTEEEDQVLQQDLDRLADIGEDVAGLSDDMSLDEYDRVEAISQAIRSLLQIRKRMLSIAHN